MANYISEQEIQKQLVSIFINDLNYDEHLYCEHSDGTLGRVSNKQVISKKRLRQALEVINDHLLATYKKEVIQEAIREITRNRSALTPLAANKEIHLLLMRMTG